MSDVRRLKTRIRKEKIGKRAKIIEIRLRKVGIMVFSIFLPSLGRFYEKKL